MRHQGPGGSPRRTRWATTPPLGPRLLILGLGCLALWILIALCAQYVGTYTLAREAARLEGHRLELLAQNATLRAEIQRLRTDDRYIERLAREQLGMLRPGEVELVLVPAVGRDPASPGEFRATEGARPLPRTIRNWADQLSGFLERLLGRR